MPVIRHARATPLCNRKASHWFLPDLRIARIGSLHRVSSCAGPSVDPILYLESPKNVTTSAQRRKLDFLNSIKQQQAVVHGRPEALDTRTQAFETAFRMQSRVPQIVDLSDESAATLELYGLERPETQHFGRQCLLARRLVEQEVPFIQIYHGGYENNWDQHGGLEDGHRNNCLEIDQPIAGLLEDLEQRGLLESTLIVWGENSVEARPRRIEMAGIIIRMDSLCGWRERG